MGSRNYYVVLGVASNESQHGVRAAFRDLAKRYHPDRIGPPGAVPFREIAEAYDVLGDPERRQRYDESLRQEVPSPGALHRRALSIRGDLVEVRPSEAAMFQRFERNFTGIGVPKGEAVDELKVDVAISREEAAKGTTLRIGVPVFRRCEPCMGRGCGGCRGRGVVEGERPMAIDLPPMSGSGTTFDAALGARNPQLLSEGARPRGGGARAAALGSCCLRRHRLVR
jgi:molecular chaperone DnaJ